MSQKLSSRISIAGWRKRVCISPHVSLLMSLKSVSIGPSQSCFLRSTLEINLIAVFRVISPHLSLLSTTRPGYPLKLMVIGFTLEGLSSNPIHWSEQGWATWELIWVLGKSGSFLYSLLSLSLVNLF